MAGKIAITGATGFVGKSVLPLLLEAGYEVSVLVRKPSPDQFPKQVRVVTGDLANAQALTELVQGADCVIHIAGAISALTERVFYQANFTGVQAVFAAAEKASVKRFIHISSLAARMPALSPYAASKRAGEDFLSDAKTKMSIVIMRPCAIYGPGDTATLPLLAALQKSIALIPGTATARFSLLHVRDFSRIILSAIDGEQTGIFEVDDLAGGHMWPELADINVRISGTPKKIIYLPRTLIAGVAVVAELISLITRKPGMITRPKLRELYHEDWVVRGRAWPRSHPIGLAEGLGETLEWYRSHGWLAPIAKRQED